MEKLKVTDSQLTKFYICELDVDLSSKESVKTALSSAKRIAYLEDLGEFSKTREVNEYNCIDEDAVAVAQGAVKYEEVPLKLFYYAGQENGVKELDAMFEKKERKQFIVVGDDAPEGGTPTYLTGEFINTKTGVGILKGDVWRVFANIKPTRLDKKIEAAGA